jgi:hypothetical protein
MTKTPMRKTRISKTRKNSAGKYRTPTPVSIGYRKEAREDFEIDHHSEGLGSLSIDDEDDLKKEFFEYPEEVTELNLADNRLKKLPDYIGNLKNLKKLNLGQNKFTVFPSVILKLTKLEELYLNHNLLTKIPETISNLKHLKVLFLNKNRFTSLPESIGELTKLSNLNLFDNDRLKILPASFRKLTLENELPEEMEFASMSRRSPTTRRNTHVIGMSLRKSTKRAG